MSKVLLFCRKNTIVLILVCMFIVFSIFGKSFLGVRNILNIFMQSAVYGVMAMGMTFLIICGYFDLSAGVVMGFIANMVILFQINGLSIAVSIFLVLLVSVAIGGINGLLVTRVNINAFIVTLATMLSIRGFTYFLCNGDQISNTERLFARYANRSFFGVSYLTLTFFVLFVICWFIMKYTRHGRNTYAIGGNAEAAFNAGIKINNVRLLNFIICSVTAGLGGIMTASRLNGATPYLGYPDGSLIVITCVVLGGTSLNGGSGGMMHTLGGTIAYVMFRNGLNMMNVPSEFNYIATGMILIGIVTSDAVSMLMSKNSSPLDKGSDAIKAMQRISP